MRAELAPARGRVIAVDGARPDRARGRTIIPEGPDTMRGVSLIGDQFVVRYLHNAYGQIRFYDLTGKFVKDLELPGLGTVSGLSTTGSARTGRHTP